MNQFYQLNLNGDGTAVNSVTIPEAGWIRSVLYSLSQEASGSVELNFAGGDFSLYGYGRGSIATLSINPAGAVSAMLIQQVTGLQFYLPYGSVLYLFNSGSLATCQASVFIERQDV